MTRMQPGTGICPHCAVTVHFAPVVHVIGDSGPWPPSDHVSWFEVVSSTSDERMLLGARSCPSCGRISLEVEPEAGSSVSTIIWPIGSNRPVPEEIGSDDPDLASDMQEAAAVLPISPQASAALSRRALQHILQRKAGVKKNRLNNQIDEILEAEVLPTALAENLDAVRVMGNFAAHPIDSQDTGAILSVEPGEAEFTLEILWEIAEHYYVRPERVNRRKKRINRILKDAGKPPLKGTDFDDLDELADFDDLDEFADFDVPDADEVEEDDLPF